MQPLPLALLAGVVVAALTACVALWLTRNAALPLPSAQTRGGGPSAEYYNYMIAATNALYPASALAPLVFPNVGDTVAGYLEGVQYSVVAVVREGANQQKKGYVAVEMGTTEPEFYAGDILVVFQGSASLSDVEHDVEGALRTWPMTGVAVTMTGTYHTGMLNVFDPVSSLVSRMSTQVLQAVGRFYHGPSQTIHVTGHSLGGALSQFCGLYLYHALSTPGIPPAIRVSVFGAPHIGDVASADRDFGGRFEVNQVIVRGDPVPLALSKAHSGLYKRWVGANGILYLCRPDAPPHSLGCPSPITYVQPPLTCPSREYCEDFALHSHAAYACMLSNMNLSTYTGSFCRGFEVCMASKLLRALAC